MYVYLWEYRVAQEQLQAFLQHYGARGSWVRLFREGAGYIGTELLEDCHRPGRFVTVDRWRSDEDHAAFLEAHRTSYLALDAECEMLTEAERLIGHFGIPDES